MRNGTYQRVFGGLGEQVLGHCRAVNRKHIEGMIMISLEVAVENINLALKIKRKSLKGGY